MAFTFKPNRVKLRTEDGTYTSPVVIGDASTAEQIAELEAAIDQMESTTIENITQIGNQIETKGQQTLDSIPEDYQELTGEVSDLKSQTGELFRNLIPISKFPGNLVVASDCIDNAYVSYANGTIISGSGYFATGYIPVTAGEQYKSNVGRNHAWYDSNKSFISGGSGTTIQEYVTAPENAAYIRFTVNKSADGILFPEMLYFTVKTQYNETITVLAQLNLNLTGYAKTESVFGVDALINDAIDLQHVIGVSKYPGNLVVPHECVDNTFINTQNGKESSLSGYFCTGYLPVTAGTVYKSNVGRNFAWYTSGKGYISGENGTAIQSGVTAPTNAAYIRFTVNKSTDGIDTPYELYFCKSSNFDLTVTIPGFVGGTTVPWCYGKKINWIGDSIVDGQDFDEVVCSALGLVKSSEYGINGSTIALKADGTNPRNALCVRYSDMSNDADIIAVSCGTNDFEYAWCPIGTINSTENTTFYGALKTLCEGLIDKYPQKLIFFTTPIKRGQPFESGNGGEYTEDGVTLTPFSKNKYGSTLGDYANIIKEVCGYFSIPVLDMYRESLLNPHIVSQQGMFDSVLTHPNATGQKIMARRVAGWLTQLGYNIP